MNVVYYTDTLIAENKKGLNKYWRIAVLEDGNNYYTQTCFWNETESGEDSIIQYSEPKLIRGKNIGKANETTDYEQAVSEVESLFKKQKDKGYAEEGEDKSNRNILPMLAQKFKRGKNYEYPVHVQVKNNGFRFMTDGKSAWSRTGKFFPSHTVIDINTFGYIVDGELDMSNELYSWQDKCKAIKKENENSKDLFLTLYDVVSDLPYSERFKIVKRIVEKNNNPRLKLCPTFICNNEDEVNIIHNDLSSKGEEGTIIRLDGEGYRPGVRSSYLLKLKDWDDAEFLVVGIIEGEAKTKGCAILVCQTPEGEEFTAVPKAPYSYRKEIFNNPQDHIGKHWKIRYKGLSEKGIPLYPRGIGIREELEG